MNINARKIIETLGLAPHPEGGWYIETWRAQAEEGDRPCGTAIYYLLEKDQISHWHRVDATEIWLWHAGAPLELKMSPDGQGCEIAVLGQALEQGERPQIVVPKGCWQSAVSSGGFTLVSCTVSPGFEFEGFEMAPEGWSPGEMEI